MGVHGHFAGLTKGINPAALGTLAWWNDANAGTLTGTQYTQLADLSGNGVVLAPPGVASQRPNKRALAFEMGGLTPAAFFHENSEQYVSQAAAASSALLHKAGCTWSIRCAVGSRSNVVLLDNDFNNRLVTPGITLTYDGTATQTPTLEIWRGGGNRLVPTLTPANGSWPRSKAVTFTVRMKAANYDAWIDDTLVANNVAYLAAASAADPGYVLRLGANANTPAVAPASMWWGGFVAYTSALSDSACAQLRAYMAARWPRGVAVYDSAPLADVPVLSGALEVLCVGDSHTSGTGSANGDGWTLYLKNSVTADPDIPGTMVGPVNGVNPGVKHDGVPGWSIRGNFVLPASSNGHAADSVPAHAGTIEQVLPPGPYTPDIIVLMLGFNNVVTVPTLSEFNNDNSLDWVNLVLDMHARLPDARFVLCSEPLGLDVGYAPDVEALNAARFGPAMTYLRNQGVVCVSVNPAGATGINPANYADNQHWNDTGNALVAPVIYQGYRYVSGRS